jgi:U4/U6.U5 tri-snRNP-associated protein 2
MPVLKNSLSQSIIPRVPLEELLKKFTCSSRYEILKYPKYLFLYLKRFQTNRFFKEKNKTIAEIPLENLCLSSHSYTLLSILVHDGDAKSGSFNSFVRHGDLSFFEIEDIHVREVVPQTLTIIESYILLYARNN